MLRKGMFLADRYEIIEQIGTGGMSDVYKAKCHKLNRYVAIKVMKSEFTARFRDSPADPGDSAVRRAYRDADARSAGADGLAYAHSHRDHGACPARYPAGRGHRLGQLHF